MVPTVTLHHDAAEDDHAVAGKQHVGMRCPKRESSRCNILCSFGLLLQLAAVFAVSFFFPVL